MTQISGKSYFTDIECGTDRDPVRDWTYYWDPICGIYCIPGSVAIRLNQNTQDKRRVSYALAARNATGPQRAIFVADNSTTVSVIGPTLPQWTFLAVDELIDETPTIAVEMLDRALLNLTHNLSHPSELVRVASQDCWKAYAFNDDSLGYILKQLSDLGYLKDRGSDPTTSYSTRRFEVQARGWEKIASMRTVDGAAKRQAFVAMWFAPAMIEYFEKGFKPAIEDGGATKALRIDGKDHNNKIDDEIIAEIRRSRYLVADFTGHREGVYYEAGFALGLGIPVIWCIAESEKKEPHFDIRQFNRIIYSSPEDLRIKLLNRIRATIA